MHSVRGSVLGEEARERRSQAFRERQPRRGVPIGPGFVQIHARRRSRVVGRQCDVKCYNVLPEASDLLGRGGPAARHAGRARFRPIHCDESPLRNNRAALRVWGVVQRSGGTTSCACLRIMGVHGESMGVVELRRTTPAVTCGDQSGGQRRRPTWAVSSGSQLGGNRFCSSGRPAVTQR